MNRVAIICAAGAAAALLGAVPALAQPYGYGYGYEPAPYYQTAPYDDVLPYGRYPVPYDGEGQYLPHRESFVGPDGAPQARCRPHKACYADPSY